VHAGDDSEPAFAPVPAGLRFAGFERGGGGDEGPERGYQVRGFYTAMPSAPEQEPSKNPLKIPPELFFVFLKFFFFCLSFKVKLICFDLF
jgi:hypothetical protein